MGLFKFRFQYFRKNCLGEPNVLKYDLKNHRFVPLGANLTYFGPKYITLAVVSLVGNCIYYFHIIVKNDISLCVTVRYWILKHIVPDRQQKVGILVNFQDQLWLGEV